MAMVILLYSIIMSMLIKSITIKLVKIASKGKVKITMSDYRKKTQKIKLVTLCLNKRIWNWLLEMS
jgi:hypothetical protein